jgi:hypothetical protein
LDVVDHMVERLQLLAPGRVIETMLRRRLLGLTTRKDPTPENQDRVDHEPTHGYAPPGMMIRQSNALLIRVVGSAIRQTWLKVAAGR